MKNVCFEKIGVSISERSLLPVEELFLNKHHASSSQVNLFYATSLFLYPLKISENLWFTDIFKGYVKRPVV